MVNRDVSVADRSWCLWTIVYRYRIPVRCAGCQKSRYGGIRCLSVSLRIVGVVWGDIMNNMSLYRPISANATLLLGYSAMHYGPDSGVGIHPCSCFDITLYNQIHADQHWGRSCLREKKCDAIQVIACTVFFLLYLYHQSIPDYKYMYVCSVKWQYRTWLEEQYSSEYSQSSTTSKLIMEIWLASQVV